MAQKKLKYKDLLLGEKARDALLAGKSTDYIKDNCAVYLNTKEVYAGLNVTDFAIAAVLSGGKVLFIGDAGCGKSQLAHDFHNYYFDANKGDGGQGLWIRGRPELDIYSEIFTQLNIDKAARELTENIDALSYIVDELNRCPPVAQNQFLPIGDGMMDYNGKSIELGKDEYTLAIATVNLGNGEYKGTFESDEALYNRFSIAIDFDYKMFRPTQEDEMFLDLIREANPNIKHAPVRDISAQILDANKDIGKQSIDLGIEAIGVKNYLRFGLRNCQANEEKEKGMIHCQDCSKNASGEALCSLIRSPSRRTLEALSKYASGLYYLAKLKYPKKQVDTIELMFKTFELIGTYQNLLNPMILRSKYSNHNQKMMSEVVSELKEDFRKNEDYILTSLSEAMNGKSIKYFFEHEGKVLDYSALNKAAKKNYPKINPFRDSREIGLKWVKDSINFNVKYRSKLK